MKILFKNKPVSISGHPPGWWASIPAGRHRLEFEEVVMKRYLILFFLAFIKKDLESKILGWVLTDDTDKALSQMIDCIDFIEQEYK